MDWFRIRHTIGMCLCLTATKRAEYLRKHDIFHHMGESCMTMFRKIPLYPKLISFGSNVWVASQVTFVTHDVIHKMLNNRSGKGDLSENIGCIDIKDNVFIGTNTTIMPNVTIGPDVIIGAGSLVTKDLRCGVYAGVPAKYMCSIDEFIEKRKKFPSVEIKTSKTGLAAETVEAAWDRLNNGKDRSHE